MPDETDTLTAAPSRGEDYVGQVADNADQLNAASDADIAKLLGDDYSPTPAPKKTPTREVEPPALAPEPKPVARKPSPPSPETKAKLDAAPKKSPMEIAMERKNAAKERNLDGFTDDEKKLLRHMPNETWAYVEPLLKKARESAQPNEALAALQKQIDEYKGYRYADHPNAYKLSPEYEEAAGLHSLVTGLGEHFRQQLAAVRAGAKEYAMPQVDNTGKIVGYARVAVTPSSGDDLLQRINDTRADLQDIERQMSAAQTAHTQRYAQHDATLNGIYENHFKKYEEVLKPLAEEYLLSFPAYFRKTQEAKLLAYSLASGKFIADNATSSSAAAENDEVRQAAAKSAGPTGAELQTGIPANAKGGDDNAALSYEAARKRYGF